MTKHGNDGDGENAFRFFERANVLVRVLEAEREQFFLWSPVVLGLGIAGYFACPQEPSLAIAFVPLVLAIIVRATATPGTITAVLLNAAVLAGLGFAITKLRVEWVRAPVLAKAMHGGEVVGTVVAVESKYPKGQRLTLSSPVIAGLAANKTPAILHVRTMSSRTVAAPGDRVRIKIATLSPPAKPPLPGGFDYARSAWFDSVGGVGFAYGAPVIEGQGQALTFYDRYRREIEDVRQALARRVRAVLPNETGEIALALITGERAGITVQTNLAYKNSGLFHILSISGLHMVIAAGAVFYSVRLLLAAIPFLALSVSIKKIAALLGILSSLAYLAISGGAFATVRSALMIVIIFGAVLLDRPALALRNVALAAFCILAVYPESLLDAGFQMSFAAVTALIACHSLLKRVVSKSTRPHSVVRVLGFFTEIIATTLIASVAVAPFAAYNFHQSQQYAVLANMIAIPICNMIVMPAALIGMVLLPLGLEWIGLIPMGWGIDGMTWCANAVGSLPGAVGHIAAIPETAFAFMLAGGIWLALWQSRLRLLGAVCVGVGLALTPWLPRPDILVAQNGSLVAVRDAQGLEALPVRSSKYDLDRWLEYDGDSRSARDASRSEAFVCDGLGCVAHVKGKTVAISRRPAAQIDDCLKADILILPAPKPADCGKPEAVIDVFDRWRNGAYALYIQDDTTRSLRIETVSAHRGERPWSVLPGRSAPATADGAGSLPKPAIRDGPDQSQTVKPEPRPTARADEPAKEQPRAPLDVDPGEGADAGQSAPDSSEPQ